ncbi:hypothetical protein BH11ACT8_BH11ACT8_24660 [soil metagenome]
MTTDATALAALAALVDTWVDGFAVSRSVPVRRSGGLTEVQVAAESRRVELVVVEPDEALLAKVVDRIVGTTDVWSTVITVERHRFEIPAQIDVRLDGEVIMEAALLESPSGDDRVDLAPDGPRAFATITMEGVQAAQGQVALVDGTAVFDRIGTHEDYRRRGLAGAVMRALTRWAVAQGAHRGLLAASVEGQPLYAGLGWRPVAAMVTLAGRG